MSSQVDINDKLLTLLSKISYSSKIKEKHKLSEIMKEGVDNEKIKREYIAMYNEMLAVNPAIADITVNRVENSNNKSGMVAQVYKIENEIIITFRGTEIDKKEQIKKDLIETDFAFVNGFITKQQADVSNLMKKVYQKFPNANYTLAGHSLGGALAVTGAVFAPDGMKENIRVVKNIDGPGVSDEFLFLYEKEIADVASKIYYHPFTPIGNLLYYLPNSNIEPIILPSSFGKSELIRTLSTIGDHSALNELKFDENGNYSISNGEDDFKLIEYISQYVDSLFENKKVNEMDFKTEQDILNYLEKNTEKPRPEYLVRGALLHCSKGSHARRLNLKKCHGVYVGEHPLIHKENCVAEGEENIPFFGVCEGWFNKSDGKTVSYKKDVRRNARGEETGPSQGTVKGPKCEPGIVKVWFQTHDGTTIVDNSLSEEAKITTNNEELSSMGIPSVTTLSFLVCVHSGLIEPYNSGQSYPLDHNDILTKEGEKEIHENACGGDNEEGMVHAIGDGANRYGTAVLNRNVSMEQKELTEVGNAHVNLMVNYDEQGNIQSYNHGIVAQYLQSAELTSDKAFALAYVYGTMRDETDIERFINAGYVGTEAPKPGSQDIVGTYEYFHKQGNTEYLVPTPALKGIKSWYESNYNDLDSVQKIRGDILSQVDTDGFYAYTSMPNTPVRLIDNGKKYVLVYPD